MSRVWRSPEGSDFVIAAKGAPEAIADLCHLDESSRQKLSENIIAMAKEGLRVLGVARARFKETDLPQAQHDFEFQFLGLVGLADPVRPGVAGAIKECYDAGIRVVMITGDYPATAQAIARTIGLKSADRVLTGPEMELSIRCGFSGAHKGRKHIFPNGTGAKVEAGHGYEGRWRGCGHDRRRRQ